MPSERQLSWSANIGVDKAQCAEQRANLVRHQCSSQSVPAAKLICSTNTVTYRVREPEPRQVNITIVPRSRFPLYAQSVERDRRDAFADTYRLLAILLLYN